MWAAIAGAVAGGLFGRSNAKKNAELSADNWTYQQSNAHQLEVQDLKNAGLNPILSATNSQMANMSPVSGSDYGFGSNITSAIQSAAQRKLEKENKLLDVTIHDKELEYNYKKLELEDYIAKKQADLWQIQGNFYNTQSANDTLRAYAEVAQISQDIQNSIDITKATVEKYGAESTQARAVAYNQLKQAALAVEQITGQKLSNEDYQTFMKNPKRLLEKDTFERVKDNTILRGLFETAHYFKSLVGGVDSVSFGKSGFRFGSSHK